MITSLIFLAAFAVALPLLWAARALTRRAGLVDRPSERKRHLGEVPLAGGIGVYATMLLIAVGVHVAVGPSVAVGRIGEIALLLGGLALMLGVVDDALNLHPALRLLCQAGIAVALGAVFDVRIASLGDVLGTGPIAFGPAFSIAFTAFCVVGALNATNMSDGLDGLLASLIALSLAALTVLALVEPTAPELLCVVAMGALGAFLVMNLGVAGERHRVFLGDSGSTLLGFLIAVLLIGHSQGPDAVIRPVVAGWLLGLPLLDTTVVVVRRAQQGRSPLRAGRDHLHHVLQDGGLSARRTLLVMLAAHAGMLAVAAFAQLSALPAWVFLYGFVALALVHFVVTARLERRAERRQAALDAARRAPPVDARAGERRTEPPAGRPATAGHEPAARTEAGATSTREPVADDLSAKRAADGTPERKREFADVFPD